MKIEVKKKVQSNIILVALFLFGK